MTIEPLESRISPAVVLNATTVTFNDIDGDDVTVKITKGTFDPAGAEFVFSTAFGDTGPQQLQKLDLSSAEFAGTNLTIIAKRNATAGGDGFVNVGFLEARDGDNIDFGSILIDGDLGGADLGSASTTVAAVKSLAVQSLGAFGTTTQDGTGDLFVRVFGTIGSLKVKTDVRSGVQTSPGDLGSASIGGSLIGSASFQAGAFFIGGKIGSIKIGGSVTGSSANGTGAISASSTIGSVSIGGSLAGGSGNFTGLITAGGDIGSVKIGRDFIASGAGTNAGQIVSTAGSIKSIFIVGSVIGGSSDYPGGEAQIFAGTDLGSVTVLGEVRGGAGDGSGAVKADRIGKITIGGSLLGGGGLASGQINAQAGDLGSVSIRGNFEAGPGISSGEILSSGNIKSITIGGNWLRTAGGDSTISAAGTLGIGSIKIAGRLLSAGGLTAISAGAGDIGSIFIGGEITGGAAGNPIASAFGAIKKLEVKGSVTGSATFPVRFTALSGTADSTLTFGKVSIGGSATFLIIAGPDRDADLGSISIGGDFISSRIALGTAAGGDSVFGTADDTILGAGDPAKFATLGSLTIKGMAYGTPTTVSNTDSFRILAEKIGKVSIGGTSLPLTVGANDLPLGITGDLRVVDFN